MTSHILNTINKFKNETEKKKRSDRNGYMLATNLKSNQSKNSNDLENNRHKVENEPKISKGLQRLLITNICLILAVVIYSSLGAFMFQLLEQHEELRRCEEGKAKFDKEIKQYREKLVNYVMYNLSEETSYPSNISMRYERSVNFHHIPKSNKLDEYSSNNMLEKNMSSKHKKDVLFYDKYTVINELLQEFRKKIIEIESSTRYYGQDCNKESRWNFYASLVFTITLMSTVGYGFIAPITWEGRVVCICYASIGIPIFLICLTNLSGLFGQFLRFAYKRIQSKNPLYKYWKRIKLKKKQKRKVSKQRSFRYDGLPLADRKSIIVIQDNQSIITGSKISSSFREYDYKVAYEYSYCDEEDEEENLDEEDEDELNIYNDEVPFLLALMIIISYILLGGLLFSYFEGWSLTESVYFVFVTLSTLGFGDLVPGLKTADKYANFKLLFICIYSSLGMAIIGMCLGQMQFAFKRKIFMLIELFRQSVDFMNNSKKEKISRKSSKVYQTKEKEEIINKIKLLRRMETESFRSRKRREQSSVHTSSFNEK